MALGNNSSAIYVDMRNGKIYRYSKTKEQGTTEQLSKTGEKKYYFIYDFIEGHVTGFSTREEEIMGQKKVVFQIHMYDKGENYIVKMGLDTTYFRMFCAVVPNIDWNYPVRLIPRLKEENATKKSSLITVNKDVPVKFAFTKENMNGKPDITVTKNKKGEVIDIDREEETQFFLNLLDEARKLLVHPAVASSNPSAKSTVVQTEQPKSSASVTAALSEDDDLPF